MGVVIAFVPVAAGARLSRARLAADFARWGNVACEPVVEQQGDRLSFDVGNCFVVAALMPAPIPPEELEGPMATSWLWPEAAVELTRQEGHYIVTVGNADGSATPLELHQLLVQATTSVLASTETALGVYNGEAGMLVSRDLYLEMARELLPDGLPIYLWIDFCVGPIDHDSGLSYGYTTGLEAFGHMELVTENASESPSQLHERLSNLADYLITHGPVILDGHTVGSNDEEKITVRYGSSRFGHKGTVMRLDYSTKKKRSWFER